MFYDRIRKGWPFNTGDCLIGDLMAWACLTVHLIGDLMAWACLTVHEDDTNIYKIQT
jgi:hypothetical protein